MADPDDSEGLEPDAQPVETGSPSDSSPSGERASPPDKAESPSGEASAPPDCANVSVDSPGLEAIDTLVDLWVALASDQRAHDSHILPDENRAVIRDTLARHAVTGGIRVARCDDATVGFVTFGIQRGAYEQDETRGVVRNVYVEPAYRGAGIGTALMDAAESALRAAGATVVSLEAMAANRHAHEFYRERGYERHRIQFEKSIAGATDSEEAAHSKGASDTTSSGTAVEAGQADPSATSAENDTHSKED